MLELAVDLHGPAGAPVILLVHGYPDTRAVWSEVVPRLARAHRVITYDASTGWLLSPMLARSR